jgi:hypothetical protein
MNKALLKEYVRTLVELKLNTRLMNRLNIHSKDRVGLPASFGNAQARLIAIDWIDETEYEIGRRLGPEIEAQVKRFVTHRWRELVKKFSKEKAKEEMTRMLDAEFSHLYLRMGESISDSMFIKHLENGLSFYGSGEHDEASQIARDWLEEVELDQDNLLAPGHVYRIEKFIANEWPGILEQYRGNKRMALIAMNNMLAAKFNDLR